MDRDKKFFLLFSLSLASYFLALLIILMVRLFCLLVCPPPPPQPPPEHVPLQLVAIPPPAPHRGSGDHEISLSISLIDNLILNVSG